ncbi:hypothetical protein W7U_05495 [Mycobacterium sp. H4Y]|nr:hypothetical protein W7U_05495 [Mycobacterium sp. H4Y]
MKVAALVIAVPRATRATGSARTTGSTRVTGTGAAGTTRPTRPAGVIGTGATGSTRPARPTGMTGSTRTPGRTTRTTGTARTARTTGSAGIIGPGGGVEAPGLRCAMTTGTGRRTARRGVGKPGAHSQGRSAQRAGHGHPSDKLLQLHDASPIH